MPGAGEAGGMSNDVVLRMQGITKAFPGVVALREVPFDLHRGEVHGLVGENGAGKSTLMKILGGAYLPDAGSIEIAGRHVRIHSPRDSLSLGISIIYQEFNLVSTLSVAENIFLGKELRGGLLRGMNRKAMMARAADSLGRLGLRDVRPSTLVRNLSIAQQQLVEIGKALFNKASILVMDEPTSVLSARESGVLFELIANLKNDGISVIFISHRLEEVIELCDRVTVLRDGEHVCTLDNTLKAVKKDALIRHMVGRVLQDYFPKNVHVPRDERLLEVRGLGARGAFHDVSFNLRKGEILGFYGLVGSGRTEIMKAVSGLLEYEAGEVAIRGETVRLRSVNDARIRGLALCPEDRKTEGLVIGMSLADNICLPNLHTLHAAGTILTRRRNALVSRFIDKLSIRPALPRRLVRDFSGGNQQKAVIAKWLASSPGIIIFDEPTRGIDVGAKSEIYRLIEELAAGGVGVVFVSSELMEIIGMCDRVIVVHEGCITGEFDRSEATQERLMKAAAGL